MQVRSSGSVKVVYLDRQLVLTSVNQAVEQLARAHPEISRVVLFGSMARGDAVPGSDVDLLIVVTQTDEPFLDRMARYTPDGIPVSVDVFPYTEAELTQMIDDGNPFIARALSEGMLVFQRTA